MKVLHHGYAYPNYHMCSCGCEYLYDKEDVVHILAKNGYTKDEVWTYCKCPECGEWETIYHYKGTIDKVRLYRIYCMIDDPYYEELPFDENTMERR